MNSVLNKRQEKNKGVMRIVNPKIKTTRHRMKTKKTKTTQKLKLWTPPTPQKNRVDPGAHEEQAVPVVRHPPCNLQSSH